VLSQVDQLEGEGVHADQIGEAHPSGRPSAVLEIVEASHAILDRLDQLWNLTMWERASSSPSLAPISIAALVEQLSEALGPLVRRNRNRLVVQPAPDVELVTDATLFACALRNLVSEAARRTQDGDIRVEAVREPGRGTDWLAVFVHDDGPILAPEALDSVYLASGDGVAIGERAGLVLAQRLARSLGGHLSAESAVGRGTTFSLRMPLDPTKVKEVTR
jgi:signal transduction histidine kinase